MPKRYQRENERFAGHWKLLLAPVLSVIFSWTCVSTAGAQADIDAPDAPSSRAIASEAPIVKNGDQKEFRIACVGDSITFGAGVAHREQLCYPSMLQQLLKFQPGPRRYDVKNFGVNGATMLSRGDQPYVNSDQFQPSLDYQPHLVFLMLGTNDSKPQNAKHANELVADTKALIRRYLELPTQPRVVLCLPVPVFKSNWGIREEVLRKELVPKLRQAAFESQAELIDLHPKFVGNPGIAPDGIHPNAFGANRIATEIFEYTIQSCEDDFQFAIPQNATKSDFFGFDQFDFSPDAGSLEGVACKIVAPRRVAKGRPWIWRARFWAHEPQLDLALLQRGWHVVYCDVADLFGAPEAVQRWNEFYRYLTDGGLSQKPVLQGMSRGGLIIHNWALANPKNVAGIIADNAVLDIRSWPAGFGTSDGSPENWTACRSAYSLTDDAAAKNDPRFAIERLQKIRDAKIPCFYLVATDDKIVPPDENSLLAQDLLGNLATVHLKHGSGHHPHSLPDPSPMVQFAQQCVGIANNPAVVPRPSCEFRGTLAGWGSDTWRDQHDKINALAADNRDIELVFFGDSITQSWTGAANRLSSADGKRAFDQSFGRHWKTASFGVSGDRTEQLIFRTLDGNFDGLSPRVVVVMIGVNNLGAGHTAKQVAEGIETVVANLKRKLPKTKILLLGPLPAGIKPDDPKRKSVTDIHQQIRHLGRDEQVVYQNIGDSFIDEKGELKGYTGDGIHLRPSGYQIWADAITPTLESLMETHEPNIRGSN